MDLSKLSALEAAHPAPWHVVRAETGGYYRIEDANGVEVLDDGSAGGEYAEACPAERMALICALRNAAPALLRLAEAAVDAELARDAFMNAPVGSDSAEAQRVAETGDALRRLILPFLPSHGDVGGVR